MPGQKGKSHIMQNTTPHRLEIPSQSVGTIDVTRLLKAWQAVTHELELEALLPQVLQTVAEISSARRNLILTAEDNQWFIEAEGTYEDGEWHMENRPWMTADIHTLSTLPVLPVAETMLFPPTIIAQVAHTHDMVVINDISRARQFSDDSYIVVHQPGSLLCAPLVHKNTLVGLLYLEHYLVGTFSRERTELVRLLTEPIATALAHARQHWHVEEQLALLNARLSQTNDALQNEIADHKHTIESLRESEQCHRLMTDHATDMISHHTPKGVYLYASPACTTLLGYAPEELFGSCHCDLIHPDDQAMLCPPDSAEIDLPLAHTLTYRIRHKAGHYIWLESSIKTLRDSDTNAVKEIIAVSRDITERKETGETIQESHEQLKLWVDELQQYNRDITLINGMSDQLQLCLTPAEAYQVVAQSAARLFVGYGGALFIFDAPGKPMKAAATWGNPSLRTPAVSEVEHMLQSGRMRRMVKSPCQGFTCVPLFAQEETLGALCLQELAENSSPQEHERWERLAIMVADHASLSIINLQLRERLHQQAIRDPLTNLFNRRYLDETLNRELQRATRHHYPVGIIMLDIDHFKNYNDRYGHEGGDTLLREIGRFLQSHIRNDDIACRFGGEEFTLILPGAALDDATRRADSLCQEVRYIRAEYNGHPLEAVTISLGVACFPLHGTTAGELVVMADSALYRAKAEGRNRVCVASLI
jgi:diguanylate cyclase (GGDEF)-like protein/PAS domain S-box-containing protein